MADMSPQISVSAEVCDELAINLVGYDTYTFIGLAAMEWSG